MERHAETLLPQYLGMYRVTVNDTETYLVVMKNVFSPRLNIHKKYDLKVRTQSFIPPFRNQMLESGELKCFRNFRYQR